MCHENQIQDLWIVRWTVVVWGCCLDVSVKGRIVDLLAHKDADGNVQTLYDHLHNAGD